MYFPYLRGKQYELIALKDISDLLAVNKAKVSPIIEPVKDSSTLLSTLKELRQKKINFTVIINPKVGDLQASPNSILTLLSKELFEYKNYQVGVILSGKENHRNILASLNKYKDLYNKLTLIHNSTYDNTVNIVHKLVTVFAWYSAT